jgi:hypothetical protein
MRVANEIQVRFGASDSRSDPEIACDLIANLNEGLPFSCGHIKSTVKDGRITLGGECEWNYQLLRASDCARRVNGVGCKPMKALTLANLVSAALILSVSQPAMSRGTDPGLHEGSLRQAVQALEHATGGKVLEIRLSDEPGEISFDAVIAKGKDLLDMHIAGFNDTVTSIDIAQLPAWMVGRKLTEYMSSIHKAKLPLADAIGMAERKAKEPAVGAALAKPLSGSNAVLAYNVEVMRATKARANRARCDHGCADCQSRPAVREMVARQACAASGGLT